MSVVLSESSARRYALDPDVRLMLEVREGNAAAFEELVARYQDRLVTVLEHLVGDRDQAEDLAQDVFLRMYRARKSYQPTAKFATWLFTIANNLALNAIRSRSRRREQQAPLHDSGPMSVASPGRGLVAGSGFMPTRRIDKAELREVVRSALEHLNERQRLAVLLNKFEGMSYEDIGQTLGLTPPAVKSLLARARSNLREILEPYLSRGQAPPIAESTREPGEEIGPPPDASPNDLPTEQPVDRETHFQSNHAHQAGNRAKAEEKHPELSPERKNSPTRQPK